MSYHQNFRDGFNYHHNLRGGLSQSGKLALGLGLGIPLVAIAIVLLVLGQLGMLGGPACNFPVEQGIRLVSPQLDCATVGKQASKICSGGDLDKLNCWIRAGKKKDQASAAKLGCQSTLPPSPACVQAVSKGILAVNGKRLGLTQAQADAQAAQLCSATSSNSAQGIKCFTMAGNAATPAAAQSTFDGCMSCVPMVSKGILAAGFGLTQAQADAQATQLCASPQTEQTVGWIQCWTRAGNAPTQVAARAILSACGVRPQS